MPTLQRAARPLLVLTVTLAIAACSGAAAPSAPTGSPSADLPSVVPPAGSSSGASAPPGLEPAGPSADPGGGGSPGDPGTGIGGPIDPTPVDPGAGQPTLVIPRPGQLNPHPVAPQLLRASVDGRHVLVKITWTSGVEPCNVLDSVKIATSGTTIALTVLEGSSDANGICIEIAMVKATIVDLGELTPGMWTITAPGSEAVPITLTIS